MPNIRSQSGFTLLELMVVCVIVAILAAIAYPSYTAYVLRGELTEAKTNLADWSVRMEQFYQDNRSYEDASGNCGAAGPAAASVKYFTYSCSLGNSGQTFTSTATGTGPTAGFTFTIDQAGNKATTAAPSGWTTAASCWVSQSNGSC